MKHALKIAAIIILALALPGFAGSLTEEFHQTYSLAQGGRVSLDNVNGDVRITGWDRNEVKVDAIKRSRSDEGLKNARIEVDADSNSIHIETKYSESRSWGWNHDSADVDYTITVPRGANLDEISLVNGDIDIADVQGDVSASSVNGRIQVRGLRGDLDLSTVNGPLEATVDQISNTGRIELESVNGPITVYLPSSADAQIEAETVSGSISNDFGLQEERDRYVGEELSGKLGNGSTRISLENVNGSISLRKAK